MSDARGTIVLKSADEINQKLAQENGFTDEKTIVELVEYSGLSRHVATSWPYSISQYENAGGFVSCEIEADGWLHIARTLVLQGKNIELYANLTDEYGGAYLLAISAEIEKFHFHYETDGGDMAEQDDYIASDYQSAIEENQNHWQSLLPTDVRKAFPKLTEYPKLML